MDIERIRHLKRDFNDFKLERRPLGKGQFGCVYSCIDKKNGKIYAIKLLELADYASTEDIHYRLFIREVMFQSRVKHHALLPFYRWGDNCKYENYGEVPFIMSPLMKNGSLNLYINENKIKELDPTKRMIIIYGTAVGMKYLHDKGILHRDLKPTNILIDEHYHPYICDFGFSRFFPPNNTTPLSIRPINPHYISPELLDDDVEFLSDKADVYSFGVIMFNVLTGKQFCELRNIFKIVKYVADGERPSIPKEVNEFYADLIKRCWNQSPDVRPSFEEIVDLLEKQENLLPVANKKKFDKYKEFVNEEIPSDDDNDDGIDDDYDDEEEDDDDGK